MDNKQEHFENLNFERAREQAWQLMLANGGKERTCPSCGLHVCKCQLGLEEYF